MLREHLSTCAFSLFSPLSPPEIGGPTAYATRTPPVTAADPAILRRPDLALPKGGRAPECHFSHNPTLRELRRTLPFLAQSPAIHSLDFGGAQPDLDRCPRANFDLLGFGFRAGARCDFPGHKAAEDGPEASKGRSGSDGHRRRRPWHRASRGGKMAARRHEMRAALLERPSGHSAETARLYPARSLVG